MDAFLDQSLKLDEKSDLMIELVTTGNINVDILSWMSDQNEEVIYSSEFLEMFLKKALTSERLTGRGRYEVFRDILEFCSSEKARVLVFKYGDLVPEIFQYYLIMVREELTPEQIVAYAEYTLPRISEFTSKFIIKANLSVAKEKLEKASDSDESDGSAAGFTGEH